MRWAIEPLFGWEEGRQEASFAEWFKPEQVSVITADALDGGRIQQCVNHRVNLRPACNAGRHLEDAALQFEIGLVQFNKQMAAQTIAIVELRPTARWRRASVSKIILRGRSMCRTGISQSVIAPPSSKFEAASSVRQQMFLDFSECVTRQ
jgi:hypothetical protein